ncbi:hydrogenase maturation protease [Thermodesulfobacteriota bacterium]
MIEDLFEKSTLVLGCGNILLGDDGFGPAVIERLNQEGNLPDDVLAMDMGTSIRDILFDITLNEKKPEMIFIVDAVARPDKKPGEVFEIPVEEIPENKTSDFSLHQHPTVNMLAELQDNYPIVIRIIVAQMEIIPEDIAPGLSVAMQEAVKKACEKILSELKT